MAPNTTGDSLTNHLRIVQLCEKALKLAEHLLVTRGTFLTKLFEGPEEPGN
jgi:23S rRNA U2552 (ribose-2'-O)-methylase RlmE/FtsJ